MHLPTRSWWPPFVTLAVALLIILCRWLGFDAGIALGITPASGLALAAALMLRWPGVLAATAGFALGDALCGLAPAEIAVDATTHGLAALAARAVMRHLARACRPVARTDEWLIFAVGVCISAAIVAVVFGLAAAFGTGTGIAPLAFGALTLLFEALGILSFASIVISFRTFRPGPEPPHVTIVIASVGILSLGALWLFMSVPLEFIRPSEMAILLSVPFAIWLAMQPRSFESAVITFLVMHAALYLILRDSGSVMRREFVVTALHLTILLMALQIVHAINLDRLAALAENARHQAELEARVAERTARLRAMTERAIAADEAKGKFLATVSHELRTPLNGVIGMAAVVLAGRLAPELRRNVELIHKSGLHLLSVINPILEFSRLGHEAPPDTAGEFDIAEVLAEVAAEARFAPEARGLVIEIDIAPDFVTLRQGDRQHLRQIFTNLVGNALKFTDSGCVVIRVADIGGDWLRGEVQDTGIGIPREMLQRIFRPFEQGDATPTRRYGGTGLGLAICSEIVGRMGGRIGVSSEMRTGSVFWFEVPLPAVLDAAPAMVLPA